MNEQVKHRRFQKKTLKLLEQIKTILEEYASKEIKVTLRQLYYKLVARNLVENNLKTYGKISRDVSQARYAGFLDWEGLVDNKPFLHLSNFYGGMDHLLNVAIESYELDRWEGQDYYIEVWCEKDALRSIIEPVCNKYQVSLFIPGGRVSTTMIKEAADRMELAQCENKHCKILYLGDHDPCGLDMVLRDIPKRFKLFSQEDVAIIPLALTMEQIKELNIPTDQITKDKDNTKEWYIDSTGTEKCWEIDALDPEFIRELVEGEILENLDKCKFDEVKLKESKDREQIRERLRL